MDAIQAGYSIPVNRLAAALFRRATWLEKPPDDNKIADMKKYKEITIVGKVTNEGGLTADPPGYLPNRKNVIFGRAGHIVLGYAGIDFYGCDCWWVWFCKQGKIRQISESTMISTLKLAKRQGMVPND